MTILFPDPPDPYRCPIHGRLLPCIDCPSTKALARAGDPDTSKEAALRVDTSELEAAVLIDLRVNGPSTGREIAARTGLPLNSVTPRTAPLTRKNLIAVSLRDDHLERIEKGLTPYKRRDGQQVWKALTRGEARAKAAEEEEV